MQKKSRLFTLNSVPFILALVITSMPLTLTFLDKSGSFRKAGELNEADFAANINTMIAWAFVYLAAMIAFLAHPIKLLRVVAREPLIIFFLIIAGFSAARDQFPLRAAIVWGSFFFIILVAFLAAQEYRNNPLIFFRTVLFVLSVALVLELILALWYPTLVIDSNGRWCVWHDNPNALGKETFIVFVISLFFFLYEKNGSGIYLDFFLPFVKDILTQGRRLRIHTCLFFLKSHP